MASLLDAGIDDELWDYRHHGRLAQVCRLLIEAHAGELLPQLLSRYAQTLPDDSDGWPARRMLLAVVAACLEVMPQAVQQAWLGPPSLEQALVQSALDANSFTSRRHALTALSYLRSVMAAVTPVLVAGLRDNVGVVQQDALEAAKRFRVVDPALLDELGGYLSGPSIRTARGVAQMLAALGAAAVAENNDLRRKIITLLVAALEEPGSQRGVEQGERLEDGFYEALLQVAGWPA